VASALNGERELVECDAHPIVQPGHMLFQVGLAWKRRSDSSSSRAPDIANSRASIRLGDNGFGSLHGSIEDLP
jgi:hypothetical protein